MLVDLKDIKINSDLLFNTILVSHEEMIKDLIKKTYSKYNINHSFFFVINKYIDIDKNKNYKYPGLIIRTNVYEYAILFLEDSTINENLALNIIYEYINDVKDIKPSDINITKFSIKKDLFLKLYSKNRA